MDPQSAILDPAYSPALEQNSTPATDDYSDIYGLPSSDGTTVNPVVQVADPSPVTSNGFLSSLETTADNALNSVEDTAAAAWAGAGTAATSILTGAEHATATAYGAVKTVGSDAVSGVKNVVSFGVSQTVLLALGLGVAIYIATKTGAFKILL